MSITELIDHLEKCKMIYGDIGVQLWMEDGRRDPDPMATMEDEEPHFDVRNGVLVI